MLKHFAYIAGNDTQADEKTVHVLLSNHKKLRIPRNYVVWNTQNIRWESEPAIHEDSR